MLLRVAERLKMKSYVYMAVTPDEYELPLAFFENIHKACEFSNKSQYVFWAAIRKQSIDKVHKCKYVSVKIEKE